MLLIRPETVTAAMLTATNIVETAPAAWAGGTTYSTGQQVSVYTGTTAALYQSLQNSNTGNTPASSPTWWQPIGSAYAAYAGGTTYALGDRVQDNTNHLVYESAQGSNVGHALTDPAWWIYVSPTNKWAMFDQVNGTVTSHPSTIDFTLAFTNRVDSVALFNLANVSSAQLIVSTVADGTIHDETVSLISTSGITNWYSYFFEAIALKAQYLFTALPLYLNATVHVIMTGTGAGNAQCGTLVCGLSKNIGRTLHDGAQVGITDYSRKTADDFGNFSIVERAYAARGAFRIRMVKSAVDDVAKLLATYRATPIVYSGATEYGASLIYGFFKDFTIEIDYPLESLCSLEIEGLT